MQPGRPPRKPGDGGGPAAVPRVAESLRPRIVGEEEGTDEDSSWRPETPLLLAQNGGACAHDALRCATFTALAGLVVGAFAYLTVARPQFALPSLSGGGATPYSRGLVSELYTFGAPGNAITALRDPTHRGGCIPGLRVYSSTQRQGANGRITVTDPVAWITAQFNFSHPAMEVLVALEDNVMANPISPCRAEVSEPPRDDFWWTGGHSVYESVLRAHADFLNDGSRQPPATSSLRAASGASARGPPSLKQRLDRAHLMAHFSFMIYSDHPQRLSVDAPDWGWTLVGFASSLLVPSAPLSVGYDDHVALYQNDETLECALVFEGTDRDDRSDWISDAEAVTARFCGLGLVHEGFRNKLLQMLQGADYRQAIRSKLPACASVAVTGHSLGGAQAELFTVCANHHVEETEPGFPDYQLVAFELDGLPARLPAFFNDSAEGDFVRNVATGLCLDVKGSLQTQPRADLILFGCEFPSPVGGYSLDQRWEFTSEGRLVNGFSGKCVDVAGLDKLHDGGAVLVQRVCELALRSIPDKASTQLWELTPEGFWKSRTVGRCVDSKMMLSVCPYTDQKWDLTSTGHIVNRLSGLCLDVVGDPGRQPGARLVLWPCEDAAVSDQRWEISEHGTLKNTLSGLCVDALLEDGSSSQAPALVLARCRPEPGADLQVQLLSEGFLRSLQTGKCVDVEGSPGTEPNVGITMAPCEDKRVDASGLWASLPGGFLRNVGSDWRDKDGCVEVMGTHQGDEKEQEGAKLHLDVCKTATDQKWTLEGGHLKNVLGQRKCVDIKPSPEGSGDTLWLRSCAEWLMDRWRLTDGGELQSLQGGRCLAVRGGVELGVDGVVALEECGAELEALDLRPDGSIIERLSGSCLGLAGGDLGLRPCIGSSTVERAAALQAWDLTAEGFLQARGTSFCVLNAEDAPGLLTVGSCPSVTQQWELTETAQLWNAAAGVCLQATREDQAVECTLWSQLTGTCADTPAPNGWKLVTAACDVMHSHQRWELVSPL